MKTLRISSWPSVEKEGVGLAAFHLAQIASAGSKSLIAKERGLNSKPSMSNCVTLREIDLFYRVPILDRLSINICQRLSLILRIFVFNLKALAGTLFERYELVHVHSPMFLPILVFHQMKGAKAALSFHGSDFNQFKSRKF